LSTDFFQTDLASFPVIVHDLNCN